MVVLHRIELQFGSLKFAINHVTRPLAECMMHLRGFAMTSGFYRYMESRFTAERFMGILHSFFDESGKFQDHQVVAFCGFGASESQLADFDKQWNNQLRRTGMEALHWVKARRNGQPLSSRVGPQTSKERINELKPFANCVNDYLGLGIATAFEVTGYTSFAPESKKLLGGSDNPFYVQFLRTVMLLAEFARPEESINMMCDEDEETAWNCYRLYRRVKEFDPKTGRRLAAISFACISRHFKRRICCLFCAVSRRSSSGTGSLMNTGIFSDICPIRVGPARFNGEWHLRIRRIYKS